MVRIKALPERTGEQVVDATNFWFGIDVISEDKTVRISGQEMTELIGGGVTGITFTPTPGDPDEVTIDIGGTTAVVPLADDTPGSETAGLMTYGEKAELDLVSDLRTTFSVLSGTTSVRIGTFGVTGGDIPLTEVYISPATITTAGVMTGADKTILNSLATGAQAIRTGDAIEVRFNYAPAQDAVFPDVDWQGAGPMPQLGGAWMALANEPFGPPDASNEYLFGFNYTLSPATGSVQAFKFDYEFLTGTHGLTAADIGKPLLWNGTSVSVYNDASTDWPTGILKYVSGTTRVAFARPGDILTIPIAQLDPTYSYPADGRFMFWDRNKTAGGQWVALKPVDSLDILPDMIEVMGVTAGVSFLARVTEFGPAAGGGGTASPLQPMARIVSAGGTPSVADASVIHINGTITNFTGGEVGQRITIVADDTSTIVHNATLIANTAGVNLSRNAGQTATYVLDNTVWRQT